MQMVPEAGGGSVGWLSARPDRPLRPFHGLDCPQRGTPTDPDPKYRGWDDPVPAPAVPGTRAWIFRGPPVALHIPRSSIVSLPVSRVSLRLSPPPAAVARARAEVPAERAKSRAGKVAADGERGGGSGQERRRSEEVPPRAADLEEDQCSRFPDAGGGGLEDRACGGRGEGEGRPTRSGKRRRSSRLVRGSRSGSGDSFSSLKRQRLRRR